MVEPIVDLNLAKKFGLLEEEYLRILSILKRVPTYTELGIFSVMWSEHCSYKNSIAVLKTLPRSGKNLMANAGEENAGLVDIGDGLAVAFKIESHNHPSAVEPYQGAATGVGGIHRDIFTMGARPIATLNSLRFGNPGDERVRYLIDGVVRGIGDYGNAFGVPTVAGEVYFDDCYAGNPLVNAMSVGVVEHQHVAHAIAKGEGNPVIIAGSATGRDGIHGATFASEDISENSESKRPSVQVGDPFAEKLLLEATLEAIASGKVIGIQDMGAAGLTCSTSEMSAKGIEKIGVGGMEIDLNLVPTRESAMTGYEIMLSESQERMLIVAMKGEEETIKDIYRKWDVDAVVIGKVTTSGNIKVSKDGKVIADIPAECLVLGGGAPVYERDNKEHKPTTKLPNLLLDRHISFSDAIKKLISTPNIASKRWIFSQYDSMVRTNTMTAVGTSDAAVVRLKGTNKALAMKTDCNSKYVFLNPKKGAMIAVAECARNIACTGARPLGVTNCLNFGNPYKPEVFFQFKEAVAGIGEACKKFDTPVTGGNVSFYNESLTEGNVSAVYPTPTIGIVGLLEDYTKCVTSNFKNDGDQILLLGETKQDLNGSEFIYQLYQEIGTDAPFIDLEDEKNLQNLLKELADERLIQSAHDVSEGGLAISLLESSIMNENHQKGCSVSLSASGDVGIQEVLFSESQGRVIISASKNKIEEIILISKKHKIPIALIGEVGGYDVNVIVNSNLVFTEKINQISELYFYAFENKMNLK